MRPRLARVMGIESSISITSAVADSAAAEKPLALDPINLTDGIELSDDTLPTVRSEVYTLSVKYRHKHSQ
jgi:hypothetical protein